MQSTFLLSCYFHQCIFCCTSKNVCICKYAWQKRSTIKVTTHYVFAGTAASLQLHEAIDSFGKGFHALIAHVLNCLMTGRCPRKSLQLLPKFHPLFLQNSFDFQKVLHLLMDLNHHLDCTDVSFNPENGAFSKIVK